MLTKIKKISEKKMFFRKYVAGQKKRQDLFTSAYKNLPNHDKICNFSFGYSVLRKVTPSKIFFLFLLKFKSDRSHIPISLAVSEITSVIHI
jgi:hypothetical protein